MSRLHIRDPLLETGPTMQVTAPEPGEYWVFVQTRRVMLGWPKAQDKYFKAGDTLVTSSNILKITILPDGTFRREGSTP